jgi:hypothetical protein
LIQGGGMNTLNNGTYSLGALYNATNFTAGAIHKTADAVTVNFTQVPSLTTDHWKGTATAGLTKVWAASTGNSDGNWSATAGGFVQSLVPGADADVFISSTSLTIAPSARLSVPTCRSRVWHSRT